MSSAGARIRMKEGIAVENLREVKEIFDRFGVRYWLDLGTLLGTVRDGKIIKWDHDIDLGTMEDSWEKIASALPEFGKKGFDIHFAKLKVNKNFFQKGITFHRFECPVTVHIYQAKGENVVWVWARSTNLISLGLKTLYYLLLSQIPGVWSERVLVAKILKPFEKVLKCCISLLPHRSRKPLSNAVWRAWRRSGDKLILMVVPKHYFEKLGTIKFYGMTFNIPSNVENYLEYKYGEDWRTPKREWDWQKEDGAVRTLTAR